MTTLDKKPVGKSGLPDATRRIIATVGDTAYVDDLISGAREEWRTLKDRIQSAVIGHIDGRVYQRIGYVRLVKREEVLS